jgi:hypoxanthine phosphoribosyltransferase
MKKPKIFISYCHADLDYKNKLDAHLTPLRHSDLVDVWFDGHIKPGDEWEKAIDDNINEADIILLLISIDFITSKYCYSIELKKAIERHENGTARVIPIIIRYCNWEHQLFAKFQVLPYQGKPVTSFSDKDEAFAQIVAEIHTSIKSSFIPIKDTRTVANPPQIIEKRYERDMEWIMPWREFTNQVNKISDFFSVCDYQPDFLFGISNGGLIAADLLSRQSFPNAPLFSLWADRTKMPNEYFSDIYNKPLIETIKSVDKKVEILVVDDNISTGQTFIQTALFLKNCIQHCHIAYVPLFTRNRNFEKIKYMQQCIIWNHKQVKPYLSDEFDVLNMHMTNYYEFPYGKGIKSIS